jgi:hypothetical protein
VADREVFWEGWTLTTARLWEGCTDDINLFRDGTVTPLSVAPAESALAAMNTGGTSIIGLTQSAGGRVVVETLDGCEAEEDTPSVLLSYDLQTLAPTVVLDVPYGTFGADQTVAYADGPSTWVLGR